MEVHTPCPLRTIYAQHTIGLDSDVQFKKREKHPLRSVTFSKVCQSPKIAKCITYTIIQLYHYIQFHTIASFQITLWPNPGEQGKHGPYCENMVFVGLQYRDPLLEGQDGHSIFSKNSRIQDYFINILSLFKNTIKRTEK